jgi:3-hydroxybutyryl-CoA dehydrogenase
MNDAKPLVGVVGAGLMGAEIALVFALAGFHVTLTDRDAAVLERARARLGSIVTKGIEAGRMDASAASALDHINFTADLNALAAMGFVTEAVFESLAVKTTVFEALDEICAADCLIATNTSTIPISTLAATLSAARRPWFVGTHYFSPVSRMKLVEVIPQFETSAATLSTALKVMGEIGKVAIQVKDVAGFAVNRMLHALMIEAVRLVDEGVATPADLDLACKLGLGHAIGPFALMDVVTSSLCVQAQEIMQEAYGERFRPPALLKQRVQAGYGGGKGRPGWFA